MIEPTQGLDWRTARRCGNAACVEVASNGDQVLMRDSKDRPGGTLQIGRVAWKEFVEGAKGGDFDF